MDGPCRHVARLEQGASLILGLRLSRKVPWSSLMRYTVPNRTVCENDVVRTIETVAAYRGFRFKKAWSISLQGI